MIQILARTLMKIEALPEVEQERLVDVIEEFVGQAEDHSQFTSAMQRKKYRNYVERELAAGEADIQAGRTVPLSDAVAGLTGKLEE